MRYFFHFHTNTVTTDTEGTVFETGTEARHQAIRTLGQMMNDSPKGFWDAPPWKVVVTDERDLVCWEISVDGFAPGSTPA